MGKGVKMKRFKRVLCVLMVAVMLFCTPATVSAESRSNTAAISINGILDVFFSRCNNWHT